jgi:hypothetical protein
MDNEFQSTEVQTENQPSVTAKALEEIKWLSARRNGVASLARAFSYDIAQMTTFFQDCLDNRY